MRTGFSIQGVLSRCSGGGLSVSRCLRLVFPVPAGPNTSMFTMLIKTCPCFIASSNNRFDSKQDVCMHVYSVRMLHNTLVAVYITRPTIMYVDILIAN